MRLHGLERLSNLQHTSPVTSSRPVAGMVGALLLLGCGTSTQNADSTDTSSGSSSSSTSGGGASGSGGSGGDTNGSGGAQSGSSSSGGGSGPTTSTSTTSSGGSSTGGSSTSSGGSTTGGDVCSGPVQGQACADDGAVCEIAGTPCGSVFTCRAGTWREEVVCVSESECPEQPPTSGELCELESPAAGLQICLYEQGCGRVQADCDGASWTVRVTPAATACTDLCQDLCGRLLECGIGWADRCMNDCSTAYECPGETVGQDVVICEARQADLADLACADLCSAVTDDQNGRDFGEDCAGL